MRTKRFFLQLLFLAVMFSLAAVTHTYGRSPSPGKYKEWNGIDEVEIVQSFKLSDYTKIIILPLDTDSAKLPPRDDNTYKPVKKILSRADEIFLEGLRDEIDDNIKIVPKEQVSEKDPEIESGKVLILKGRVTEINPGSRALRIWVGFGAGRSRVEVAGELLDAKSQNTLLRFKQGRLAAMDTRSYEKTLEDDLERIGKDIGKMLNEF